ncbi:hypothetical protein GCM10023156_55840 [Novipirellula rosea]|uniref:Uncharacterized protein n=1 Tax=Novipirellula rosea TaxID=1031540 RepID=A0ABP8NG70_9BACT
MYDSVENPYQGGEQGNAVPEKGGQETRHAILAFEIRNDALKNSGHPT